MLTAEELAAARADARAELPDTATIRTPTETPNGRGGVTATYSGSTTVPCRLNFLSGPFPGGSDVPTGGGVSAPQLFVVTLPHDAPVTDKDRLVINGVAYEIVSAVATRSEEITKRLKVKFA
jgi:hypothetical protein